MRSVVGRVVSSTERRPETYDYVKLHGKEELKFVDGNKVTNELTLKLGDYVDYVVGPM